MIHLKCTEALQWYWRKSPFGPCTTYENFISTIDRKFYNLYTSTSSPAQPRNKIWLQMTTCDHYIVSCQKFHLSKFKSMTYKMFETVWHTNVKSLNSCLSCLNGWMVTVLSTNVAGRCCAQLTLSGEIWECLDTSTECHHLHHSVGTWDHHHKLGSVSICMFFVCQAYL